MQNDNLPLSTITSIGGVNKYNEQRVKSFFILLAKSYGYQGNTDTEMEVQEAKDYLQSLFYQLNCLDLKDSSGYMNSLADYKVDRYESSHKFCSKAYKASISRLFEIYYSLPKRGLDAHRIEMICNLIKKKAKDLLSLESLKVDQQLLGRLARKRIEDRRNTSVRLYKVVENAMTNLGLMLNFSNIEWHVASLTLALADFDIEALKKYFKRPDCLEIINQLNLPLDHLLVYASSLYVEEKGTSIQLINSQNFNDLVKELYPETYQKTDLYSYCLDRIQNMTVEDLFNRSGLHASVFEIAARKGLVEIFNLSAVKSKLRSNRELLVSLLSFAIQEDQDQILKSVTDIGVDWKSIFFNMDNLVKNGNLVHLAAIYNAKKSVQLFIELGLDIHAIDNNFMTPLMIAIQFGSKEVALELIQNQASLTDVSVHNLNIFHIIAGAGLSEVLDVALANLDPELIDNFLYASDSRGYTPFIYALNSINRNRTLIQKLINYDVRLCHNLSFPVENLSDAINLGNKAIFKTIWENNVVSETNQLETLINMAAEIGQSAILDVMLSGENWGINDRINGRSFELAIKNSHQRAAMVLLNSGRIDLTKTQLSHTKLLVEIIENGWEDLAIIMLDSGQVQVDVNEVFESDAWERCTLFHLMIG